MATSSVRYMPVRTLLAIVAVRLATLLLVLLPVVLAFDKGIAWGWMKSLPVFIAAPLWIAWFIVGCIGMQFLCNLIPSERIAALVSRKEDADLDLSPRTNAAIVTGGCILVVALVLNS